MSNQWYIYREGRQSGPFSRNRLDEMARRGELQPNDQFWAEGMPGWVPGSEVPGLFGGGLPPQAGSPAQAASSPVDGVPGGRKKMHGCVIAAIVGVGLLVLLIAAILIGISAIRGTLRSSDAYREAMFALQSNPQALQLLGEPVETGRSVSGSINVSGVGGEAELIIPVSGTMRKGSLVVEAIKSGGQWTTTYLLLETDDGERLDLLAAGTGVPEGAAIPAGDMNYFSDPEYGFSFYYPRDWDYSVDHDGTLLFLAPQGSGEADLVFSVQLVPSARQGGIYDSIDVFYDDISTQFEVGGGTILSREDGRVAFGNSERLHDTITFGADVSYGGHNYLIIGTLMDRDDLHYYLLQYVIPTELGIAYLDVYNPYDTFELIGLD